VPFNVTVLTGKVMVISVPAFATGATLGAGFTITVSWSSDEAPSLSVTFSLNT
jgi:hypothetical protein